MGQRQQSQIEERESPTVLEYNEYVFITLRKSDKTSR